MLIYCKECEHQCSDKAAACPSCGHPLELSTPKLIPQASPVSASVPDAPPAPPKNSRYEYWATVKFYGCIGSVIGIAGCAVAINNSPAFGGFSGMVGALSLIIFLVGKAGAWMHSDKRTVGGHTASRSFHTKIVGVTHHNDNGSSRQKYIERLGAGQRLRVARDAGNEYDKNAIAVFHGRKQLGFLSKDLSSQFASVLDEGGTMECAVSDVTGGGGMNYGCNISITVYG